MLRRTVQVGVVAGILALIVGGLCLAQQGGAGLRGGGRRNFDPDQTEQMMMVWIKMQLRVTDDAEWKVIEPRLQKVVDLTQQVVMGRVRGMMDVAGLGRGGMGGGDQDTQALLARGSGLHGEMTALDKAMTDLGKTRANQDAAPEDFKKALAAVHEAWFKLLQDRAAAQADLRKILTPRQEAVLVQMVQLD